MRAQETRYIYETNSRYIKQIKSNYTSIFSKKGILVTSFDDIGIRILYMIDPQLISLTYFERFRVRVSYALTTGLASHYHQTFKHTIVNRKNNKYIVTFQIKRQYHRESLSGIVFYQI